MFVFDLVIETLFNGAKPAAAETFEKGYTPHAIKAFDSPVSTPLWTDPAFNRRRVYIKTVQDNTFPPVGQQYFVDNCGVSGEVLRSMEAIKRS